MASPSTVMVAACWSNGFAEVLVPFAVRIDAGKNGCGVFPELLASSDSRADQRVFD